MENSDGRPCRREIAKRGKPSIQKRIEQHRSSTIIRHHATPITARGRGSARCPREDDPTRGCRNRDQQTNLLTDIAIPQRTRPENPRNSPNSPSLRHQATESVLSYSTPGTPCPNESRETTKRKTRKELSGTKQCTAMEKKKPRMLAWRRRRRLVPCLARWHARGERGLHRVVSSIALTISSPEASLSD